MSDRKNGESEQTAQEQSKQSPAEGENATGENEAALDREIGAEETALETQLESLQQELGESQENLLRIHAEFDNFRKRTQKEMRSTYQMAVADTVKQFLDVIDNLERAAKAADEKKRESIDEVQKGIALIFEQFEKVLKDLNVEEIDPKNEVFNPDFHNAVMHVEDENLGENIISEVFQKGYKLNDRVLRYAMVKVAN